jgi:integrase/recombinase XerC
MVMATGASRRAGRRPSTVLSEYLTYLKSVRNLSANTIFSYAKDMEQFAQFIEDRGYREEELDVKRAREFVSALSRRNLSAKSINRVISCVRGYYRFRQRYGRATENPFRALRSLKIDKWLPSFLVEEEMHKLLDFPVHNFLELRDKLIFEFLYSTGCRIGEMVALNAVDLDLKDGLVKVTGKGRKERIVYIGRYSRSRFVVLQGPRPPALSGRLARHSPRFRRPLSQPQRRPVDRARRAGDPGPVAHAVGV